MADSRRCLVETLKALPRLRTPPNRHLLPRHPLSASLGEVLALGESDPDESDRSALLIPDDLSSKITGSSLYVVAAPINPGADATKKEFKSYKNALKKVKSLEKRIGRTGDVFAYKQSTGEFFVDTNGKQKGFGEGGLLAVLENQPLLSIDNIAF